MKFRIFLVLFIVIISLVLSKKRKKTKSKGPPIKILAVDETALCFAVCAQDPARPPDCIYASDKVDDDSDNPIKCKCTLEAADGLEKKRVWNTKYKYERLDKGKSCRRLK
jgi:hypothetical protein